MSDSEDDIEVLLDSEVERQKISAAEAAKIPPPPAPPTTYYNYMITPLDNINPPIPNDAYIVYNAGITDRQLYPELASLFSESVQESGDYPLMSFFGQEHDLSQFGGPSPPRSPSQIGTAESSGTTRRPISHIQIARGAPSRYPSPENYMPEAGPSHGPAIQMYMPEAEPSYDLATQMYMAEAGLWHGPAQRGISMSPPCEKDLAEAGSSHGPTPPMYVPEAGPSHGPAQRGILMSPPSEKDLAEAGSSHGPTPPMYVPEAGPSHSSSPMQPLDLSMATSRARAAKAAPSRYAPSQRDLAEAGPSRGPPPQVYMGKVGPPRKSRSPTPKVGFLRSQPSQINIAEAGPPRISRPRGRPPKPGHLRRRQSSQIDAAQAGPSRTSRPPIKTPKAGLLSSQPSQIDLAEAGPSCKSDSPIKIAKVGLTRTPSSQKEAAREGPSYRQPSIYVVEKDGPSRRLRSRTKLLGSQPSQIDMTKAEPSRKTRSQTKIAKDAGPAFKPDSRIKITKAGIPRSPPFKKDTTQAGPSHKPDNAQFGKKVDQARLAKEIQSMVASDKDGPQFPPEYFTNLFKKIRAEFGKLNTSVGKGRRHKQSTPRKITSNEAESQAANATGRELGPLELATRAKKINFVRRQHVLYRGKKKSGTTSTATAGYSSDSSPSSEDNGQKGEEPEKEPEKEPESRPYAFLDLEPGHGILKPPGSVSLKAKKKVHFES